MTIPLDGASHPIKKLVAIAQENEQVQLAPEALGHIKFCGRLIPLK